MLICEVVGSVWATKKENSLNGLKLMVVKKVSENIQNDNSIFVAVDVIGAGNGDRVLVVNGSTAKKVGLKNDVLIDAAIVAIIDNVELNKMD
ncbi:EutN/CcmL family microcompartment protein [Tepidibacter sp. Z1-5]|uniref:EutN/CcmL family microcompartment protein n=1 Tax=Tepidibacter sp. Z1-5 TaxID=3134138 RepID=UPI0030C1F9EE